MSVEGKEVDDKGERKGVPSILDRQQLIVAPQDVASLLEHPVPNLFRMDSLLLRLLLRIGVFCRYTWVLLDEAFRSPGNQSGETEKRRKNPSTHGPISSEERREKGEKIAKR
jgi:hypothetical protein